MPAFYLSKPDCPCCGRSFEGLNVGHGEPGQPFVFRLYVNVHAEMVTSYWYEKIAEPELILMDQWLKPYDKIKFMEDFDKYKDSALVREYYEQERIKKNSLGYLYSDVAVHIKGI